jgi:oligopeptide/dipeptide ABC transporter ATP-binding protein
MLGGYLAVIYNGQLVEYGPVEHVLQTPGHPYTTALQRALPENGLQPIPRQVNGNKALLNGNCGCTFSPRCNGAFQDCFEHTPALQHLKDNNHMVACHGIVEPGI